ncbi:hypothetical protein MAPG_05603 [Magnaporthiopsis poae ATCC 64411]|uniref:Uncharacterized protein n=1 Tax=Magnaporthiopsis poae (strain ATCC 64411 / 73-15) TaxID=644358 RepID=A0A0C4DZU5_MAGP6|nr:hypothetical protein MAPG_05603 [Magnaporthiopsis poae ATCC 64411]
MAKEARRVQIWAKKDSFKQRGFGAGTQSGFGGKRFSGHGCERRYTRDSQDAVVIKLDNEMEAVGSWLPRLWQQRPSRRPAP